MADHGIPWAEVELARRRGRQQRRHIALEVRDLHLEPGRDENHVFVVFTMEWKGQGDDETGDFEFDLTVASSGGNNTARHRCDSLTANAPLVLLCPAPVGRFYSGATVTIGPVVHDPVQFAQLQQECAAPLVTLGQVHVEYEPEADLGTHTYNGAVFVCWTAVFTNGGHERFFPSGTYLTQVVVTQSGQTIFDDAVECRVTEPGHAQVNRAQVRLVSTDEVFVRVHPLFAPPEIIDVAMICTIV